MHSFRALVKATTSCLVGNHGSSSSQQHEQNGFDGAHRLHCLAYPFSVHLVMARNRDVATHYRKFYLAVLFEALNVPYWSCYARVFLLVTKSYLFLLRLRFTRPKTLLYGVFYRRELAIKHAERIE